MPILRPAFVNEEIYHVVSRGIEGRPIFRNISDYYRGIFSLYEFNNDKPIRMRDQRRARMQRKKSGQELFLPNFKKRDTLLEILAFCLMPNHIHLLLKQLKNRGISKFMSKFGAGYAGYFNKKYNRVGHLFQGRFRAVYVADDEQLKNVFVYIHTNPAGLIEPGWKEGRIRNSEETIKFLEDYKWSSYPDYIGKTNFPSLSSRGFLTKVFGNEETCRKFVDDWIKYKAGVEFVKAIVLE